MVVLGKLNIQHNLDISFSLLLFLTKKFHAFPTYYTKTLQPSLSSINSKTILLLIKPFYFFLNKKSSALDFHNQKKLLVFIFIYRFSSFFIQNMLYVAQQFLLFSLNHQTFSRLKNVFLVVLFGNKIKGKSLLISIVVEQKGTNNSCKCVLMAVFWTFISTFMGTQTHFSQNYTDNKLNQLM